MQLTSEELELIRAHRKKQALDRKSKSKNPATGILLSLRDLPDWMVRTAPSIGTTLAQVGKALDVVLFGTLLADGYRKRLAPSESLVLLLIMSIKFKLVRVVGKPDPETLADILNYKPRIMRQALRVLESLELISIEREHGRIERIMLTSEIMDVPRRPTRRPRSYQQSYPQNREQRAQLDPHRQKNAEHISEGSCLDDIPSLLPTLGPAVLPDCPPRPPTTAQQEETLRPPPEGSGSHGGQRNRIDSAVPLLAAVAPSNGDKRQWLHGTNDHSPPRPRSGWWRSLLELAKINGPSPPS